ALNTELNPRDWQHLSFYFVTVPPERSEPNSVVDMVISKDGKPIGRMGEQTLPSPDEQGRIHYIASLPMSSLSSGNYDVSVIIRRDDASATASTAFTIRSSP